MTDTNENYWCSYGNHQKAKHDILRKYLQAWFAILGQSHDRILYLDTHAGRGKYESGEDGSPLVALRSLMEHRSRKSILNCCEVRFTFIEEDEENYEALQESVAEFGTLPRNISVRILGRDSHEYLAELLAYINQSKLKLAPAFALIDPYSYLLPGDAIRTLMSHKSVELFMNVIWREQDMARANAFKKPGSKFEAHIESIFPDADWRSRFVADMDVEERLRATMGLFEEQARCKWATYIRMLSANGATRYAMLHLSNHDRGRDIIKDCMWSACPDGGFRVRLKEDPTEYLIEPGPDLVRLGKLLLEQVGDGGIQWTGLEEWARNTIWRIPDMNTALTNLRRAKRIEAKGRFGRAANPNITLRS